nr:hypothetical protein [Methylophaga thiooxydans]
MKISRLKLVCLKPGESMMNTDNKRLKHRQHQCTKQQKTDIDYGHPSKQGRECI